MNYLPGLDLNHNSPDLSLSSARITSIRITIFITLSFIAFLCLKAQRFQ
jgi:hypothetical protein